MHYMRLLNWFAVIVIASTANSLLAAEYVASVSQELELTDNAHNTKDNKTNEAISRTTLNTELRHRTSELDLSFDYSLGHVRYHKDQFDNTNTIEGTGDATWHIVPGRMEWFVTDVETYSIVDRRVADSEDNRAQSSTLSTGPRVTLPLTPVDSATFEAEHTKSRTDTENSNESEVISGNIEWSHLLSQTKSFSIEYETSKTNFENNTNNFDSDSLEGKFNVTTSSGSYVIGVGITSLDTDSGVSTNSNSFDIEYSKNWSRSAFTFSAQRALTDTVSSFVNAGSNSGANLSQSFEIEDSVLRSTLDTSFNTPIFSALTIMDLSASFQEEEFQSIDSIQRIKSLVADLSHQLTQHLSLFATYTFQRTQFDALATERVDREHTVTLGGDLNLNNELAISLDLDANLRKVGSEGVVDHTNIRKNSLTLSLDYEFL